MKRLPLLIAVLAASTPLTGLPLTGLPLTGLPLAGNVLSAHANTKAKTIKASPKIQPKAAAKELPRYVSLETLKKLQAARARDPKRQVLPVLQPLLDGKSLKGRNLKDLATNPPIVVVRARVQETEAGGEAGAAVMEETVSTTEAEATRAAATEVAADAASLNGTRLAQAIPQPVPPAPVRRAPATQRPPRWVRYPLEFQLCGIGLGTKAVDKDRFNRIDRYGLFAIHGNPTAVVVPTVAGGTVTVNQQPPEVSSLFGSDPGGGLPDWASAITVQLDNNHVQWLYRRDTYSMGFVVDRLGFVDAIVVAGTYSPIARTQLEDPLHTVKLSDDLRKVLFRYGYPDTIETYIINALTGTTIGAAGAEAGAEAEGAAGAQPGQPPIPEQPGGGRPGAGEPGGRGGGGRGGGGGGEGPANLAFRTFEVRYEQSYNIVFTIRNNRVVRIYIFGDPDFFNEQRRNVLRARY